MDEPIAKYDAQKGYCRKLGHHLTFDYCRRAGTGGLPCAKVMDCWFEKFPVEEFIRAHYSEERIRQFTAPPPEKIVSLVDLIRQAQERNKND